MYINFEFKNRKCIWLLMFMSTEKILSLKTGFWESKKSLFFVHNKRKNREASGRLTGECRAEYVVWWGCGCGIHGLTSSCRLWGMARRHGQHTWRVGTRYVAISSSAVIVRHEDLVRQVTVRKYFECGILSRGIDMVYILPQFCCHRIYGLVCIHLHPVWSQGLITSWGGLRGERGGSLVDVISFQY